MNRIKGSRKEFHSFQTFSKQKEKKINERSYFSWQAVRSQNNRGDTRQKRDGGGIEGRVRKDRGMEEENKSLRTQSQENCKEILPRDGKQRKRRKEINSLPKIVSWRSTNRMQCP